jgi:DedD protein
MDYSRDEEGLPRKERELTLSMSAILGIFFGLVLLCGLFFGLGYNMRGRQISSASGSDADADNSANPQFNNFKPAAGSPAGSKPAVVVAPDATAAPASPSNVANGPVANAHAAAPANTENADTGSQSAPTAIVRLAPAPASGHPAATGSVATASVGPGAQAPAPAPLATGSFVVQVAAVSHQEDADLLMGALKDRGYAVVERAESQDKLVHIQIGPFAYRKDAEAMRQRLLSDGYNAIIK